MSPHIRGQIGLSADNISTSNRCRYTLFIILVITNRTRYVHVTGILLYLSSFDYRTCEHRGPVSIHKPFFGYDDSHVKDKAVARPSYFNMVIPIPVR